jgi:protein arginine kinase activator
MRCDGCGSSDSLYVVLSGMAQGEIRLCRICALQRGYLSEGGDAVVPQIDSILEQVDSQTGLTESGIICPKCRLTQEQLLETGLLGCPACVESLRRQYLAARKRRGAPAVYAGKIPQGWRAFSVVAESSETILQKSDESAAMCLSSPQCVPFKALPVDDGERFQLLADIEAAVLAEDFEKAALLRDRLGLAQDNGKLRHGV